MNLILDDDEYALIQVLKERNVLSDITPVLCANNRVILVQCADGDQRREWAAFFEAQLGSLGGKACVHAFNLNGGGALLPPDSAIGFDGEESRVLHRHIAEAMSMKGIQTIIPTVHWKCGKLLANGIDLIGALKLLSAAEDETHSWFPEAKVISAVSLNFGEVSDRKSIGMKTYLFHPETFHDWGY